LEHQQSLPSTRARRLLLLLMALVLAGLCLWGGARGQIIPGLPFHDSDDVLRMLQVLALRDGGGWYDLTQYRINPPEGLAMHWSRLPDLPLLGLLLLAEPWLGRDQAIWLTATLVPPLLGVGYFLALLWAARPLTGTAGAPQAGLIALAAMVPLLSFGAGRIDHHGWQLLLALLLAGAVLRLGAGHRGLGVPLLAGLSAALGLWVGAEAIPPLAFSALALVILWWREGRWIADRLALFGCAALAGTLAILPLALAPGHRAATACDAFSLVSVALTAALALFGAGAALAERRPGGLTGPRRAGLTLLLGLPLLVLLGLLFPDCLAGPYGEVSPEVARLAAKTGESLPLGPLLVDEPATALYFLALPLTGLLLVGGQAWRREGRDRNLWLALGVLLGGSLILPWWQFRGIHLANLYATLAFTWPAAVLGAGASQARGLAGRLWRRAGPAALVALLPGGAALLVVSLGGQGEPHDQAACDPVGALEILNQGAYRDQAPLLIAADINLGAPILWGTPHAVLAAPYHRNAGGLRDNEAIFAGDEASAREAVRRRGVDWLLICPRELGADEEGAESQFANRLLGGEVPAWLEAVPVGEGAQLFRVLANGEGEEGARYDVSPPSMGLPP
jgi:hypothetical protein